MSDNKSLTHQSNELTVIVGMELLFNRLSAEAIEQLQFDFGDRATIHGDMTRMRYMFEQPRQLATEDLEITIFGLVEHMKLYCNDKPYQMVRIDVFTCSRADFDQSVATGSHHTMHKFEIKV
jgi:hypothetical protein